eukprot:3120417-Amphidinium_carterae.1
MRGQSRTSLASERVEWRAGKGGIVHERLAHEKVETDLSTDLRFLGLTSARCSSTVYSYACCSAMDFDSHHRPSGPTQQVVGGLP